MNNTDSLSMSFGSRGKSTLPASEASEQTTEATPGGEQEVRWEIVARTPGLLQAQIIAGRLAAEGVPVRVWQEGAGQALGLTVGMLGTGHVLVPESHADQALEILALELDEEDLEAYDEYDEEE